MAKSKKCTFQSMKSIMFGRSIHASAELDVFVVGGRQQIVVRGIDHAAWAGNPPKPGRLQITREVTSGELDIRVGADDGFLAVGHVAREQYGQHFAKRSGFAHERLIGPTIGPI